MKKFEDPKLNVEVLDVTDVITTSPCPEYCEGHECDWDGGGF